MYLRWTRWEGTLSLRSGGCAAAAVSATRHQGSFSHAQRIRIADGERHRAFGRGSGTGQAFAQMTSVGKGEGEVDIVAWPGYIERGESDKSYDWVTDFEKKTGCKVNVKTAGTSDEMVALMNEGGFDLVTASGDASLRLVAGKRVQEINPP